MATRMILRSGVIAARNNARWCTEVNGEVTPGEELKAIPMATPVTESLRRDS